jgi:gas vesicle protein
MRGLVAGILTGALLGAALAMLLAPAGDETAPFTPI